MTDSQVATLRPGDVVRDTVLGIRFTVRTAARMARTNTHHEAYAVTASGALVARITYSGNYRIARRAKA